MLLAQRVTWLWCLCLSVKPLHRLRVWCSDDVLLRASYDARAAGGCAGLRAFMVALRARCDGGLRRVRRSPSRVTPLSRGPELSDDYWHAAEGWDRRSLVFRAASPKWESTSTYYLEATTPPRRQGTHITTPPTQSTGGGRGAAPSGGCTSAPDGGNLISRRRPSSFYNIWPAAP